MDIKTNIKLNKNILNDSSALMTEKNIASGWVEIDSFIKFPVNVRKYTDKEDGKEKMFVSFPQRRNSKGEYVDVVRPVSKDIRKEVQDIVLSQVNAELMKEFNLPQISNVKVTPLDQEKSNGAIKVKAVASITISGFVISGITVKEGQRGLFVQMPQYNENGQYKDTVYGTSTFVQHAISDAVLHEYESILQRDKSKVPEVHNETAKKETEQEKNTVQPIQIANARVEDGYLHFVVLTEGDELDGLFRIYAPSEGEDLQLVSIMNQEKHPHLQILWRSIEESLKERCMVRYGQMKNISQQSGLENDTPVMPAVPKNPKL